MAKKNFNQHNVPSNTSNNNSKSKNASNRFFKNHKPMRRLTNSLTIIRGVHDIDKYFYFKEKPHLDFKNIVDEELIQLPNIPLPKAFLTLQKYLDEISDAYTKETGLNIDFIVAGGVMSRLVKYHMHSIPKEENDFQNLKFSQAKNMVDLYNYLRKTDIDVFIYQNSGYDERLIKILDKYMSFQEKVEYTTSHEYRSALKITGLLKYIFQGFKVEFIFSNPSQIQCFDINHRNVFLYKGEVLTTTTALQDIKDNTTRLISVHSPVSSLIRALSFEKKEGYKLSNESVALAKWSVKKFRIDVSNSKIRKALNKRKNLTVKEKRELFKKMRGFFPESDLEHSYKRFKKDSRGYMYVDEFSSGSFDDSNGEIQKGRIDYSLVKQDAQGYDYPFHPETEIQTLLSVSDNTDSQHIGDLYWNKSFYDRVANYKPEDKIKSFQLGYSQNFTNVFDETAVYEMIYETVFENYESQALNFMVDFPTDSIIYSFSENANLHDYKYFFTNKGNPFRFSFEEVDALFENKKNFVSMKEEGLLFDEQYLLGAYTVLKALSLLSGKNVKRICNQLSALVASRNTGIDNPYEYLSSKGEYTQEEIDFSLRILDGMKMCVFLLNKVFLNNHVLVETNKLKNYPVNNGNAVSGRELTYSLYRGDATLSFHINKMLKEKEFERELARERGKKNEENTVWVNVGTTIHKQDFLSPRKISKNDKLYILEKYRMRQFKDEEEYTLNYTQFSPELGVLSNEAMRTVFFPDKHILKEEWKEYGDFLCFENGKVFHMLCAKLPDLFKGVSSEKTIAKSVVEEEGFFSHFYDAYTGEFKNKPIPFGEKDKLEAFLKEVDFSVRFININ